MKLLAIDMDETCLNSKKQISDINIRALKWAAQNGIAVVPATGRCISCLPHQLKEEHFFHYVIASNGATVMDWDKKEVISRKNLMWKDAYLLLKECRHPGIGIAAHMGDEYYVQGKPLAALGHAVYGKDAAGVKVVKNMAEEIIHQCDTVQELQLYFLNPESRKIAERVVGKYEDAFSVAYTEKYAELYDKGVSKGYGLQQLADRLQIKKEDIICIGDSTNDLSMFEVAGTKFAVGNALEELKEKADHVVATNDEDGVADAILHYICC